MTIFLLMTAIPAVFAALSNEYLFSRTRSSLSSPVLLRALVTRFKADVKFAQARRAIVAAGDDADPGGVCHFVVEQMLAFLQRQHLLDDDHARMAFIPEGSMEVGDGGVSPAEILPKLKVPFSVAHIGLQWRFGGVFDVDERDLDLVSRVRPHGQDNLATVEPNHDFLVFNLGSDGVFLFQVNRFESRATLTNRAYDPVVRVNDPKADLPALFASERACPPLLRRVTRGERRRRTQFRTTHDRYFRISFWDYEQLTGVAEPRVDDHEAWIRAQRDAEDARKRQIDGERTRLGRPPRNWSAVFFGCEEAGDKVEGEPTQAQFEAEILAQAPQPPKHRVMDIRHLNRFRIRSFEWRKIDRDAWLGMSF